MLHKSFSNVRTTLIYQFYVKAFLNFPVGSPVLLVTGGDLLLDRVDFLELFLNVRKVVVHFNVLEQGQPEVLICWHGLNLKYLLLQDL